MTTTDEITTCPECGSINIRYAPHGFSINEINEGWCCMNCRLCFGYV